ncbi:uncharacterized protein [Neodiprion pinetum]|uniref:uncharacterized protein isoform X1 n=1 Tax=Neodiprion pinetum TaxID=441929 RepID=UPI001EDCCD87|nr:uncharacterized protein LOC124217111 isoform X1 [Neodiprion pinetum]
MDNTKCPRNYFPHLKSGIKTDSTEERYAEKQKQHTPPRGKKCQGDIVYIQNPLFQNFFNNGLTEFKDTTGSCEYYSRNLTTNSNHEGNYRHKLYSQDCNFQKFQHRECNGAQINVTHKTRKSRTKARAKTRRDMLINESSDDDYCSVNSSFDLQLAGNRNSLNMNDAYNRRSRSARTERYLRRLSKDENYYDNEFCTAKISSPTRFQDGKSASRKWESQVPAPSNNLDECNPNLFYFNHNDTVLNNPIYNLSRADSPILYRRPRSQTGRKEFTENQAHGGDFNYSRTRCSDPGTDAFLAYKNNKLPRPPDYLQYVEPKIFNHEQSTQIMQLNKPAATHRVKRSNSFQSEPLKEYEVRNHIWLTMGRKPKAEAGKLGTSISSTEDKWIDSVLPPVSPKPVPTSRQAGLDFQSRIMSLPKETSKLTASNTKIPQMTDLSKMYNSSSTNLLSDTDKDQQIAKKRSSKDFSKELSELEKMYDSLRLSDDNLLDRAEERCIEEFSQKGQSQSSATEHAKYLSSSSSSESLNLEDGTAGEKYSQQSSEPHVVNDDMAYRKMQSKRMPALSETQNSLSQISYLLASSALILDKTDYPDDTIKLTKEEPNITKDDMVYRNLHYANNVLRVVEPQPPFGIPLRPATPSTNSNYLCSSPVVVKSPPLKYVPQSEPNLITDDLAFRNLRKDAPKAATPQPEEDSKNEMNVFLFNTDMDKTSKDDQFFRKKKKAVRSLSANLYGLIKEVNNLDLNVM